MLMRRFSSALLVGLLLSGLFGCGSSDKGPRRVVVAGSRDLAPLMEDVGRRFEETHPGVRIDVDPADERGAADTRTGLADVGMLGRALRPDETGLHGVVVARDGIAFILNRNNPVKSLDERQLLGLFTGTYTNWREVGGSDRPVTLVGLAEGRQLREAFLERFGLPASRVKTDPAVLSGEQAIAAVAAHPDAVGYACLGKAELASAKLPIRLLPWSGVPATLAEVRAGRYPLTRPLLLLTREPAEGVIAEFIAFARSEEVQDLLEKHGLAPPRPEDNRP
jgi:phosphate transport system substrate-binding protein